MTRAAHVAILASALLASLLPHGAGADRSGASVAVATDEIELISQDPWTPMGGELRIAVRVAPRLAGAPDAVLRFAASAPLTSRSDFDRVLNEGVRGSPIDQVEIALAPLTPDAGGARVVTIGLEPTQREAGRLALRRPGVYPLEVEILDGATEDSEGTSFTTFAVVTGATSAGLPEPLASPLGVAWVWPFAEGPVLLPDGTRDPSVLRSFQPDGRLGRQANALARAGDVPLTLVPSAETLESWVDYSRTDVGASQGAAVLVDVAGRSLVLSTTYVPTDLPSLLQAGLPVVVERQRNHGHRVLTGLLTTPPETAIALARPASAASLAYLRAAGVDRIVVDAAALATSSSRSATITRPFEIRPTGDDTSAIDAVASDNRLVALLAGTNPPALRAQHVLAGLSMIALEAPSARRAVVLASPPELDAPRDVFDALLAGLRGNPWLEPLTVADVFERVPASGTAGRPEVRAVAPAEIPDPPLPAPAYELAAARVEAFKAAFGATEPLVSEAERSLLVVESSTFLGSAGIARASATAARINALIDGVLSQIRVPDPGTITLTSREGSVPLTFRNDTGRTVRIVVTVESPKLFFPEGATRSIELPPKSTTLQLPVRARTSGTFQLRLSVRTAEGGLVIAETRFQVRSTVVSSVGLLLMIGAAVILALWWGWYILRARLRRRDEVPRGG